MKSATAIFLFVIALTSCVTDPAGKPTGVDWDQVDRGLDTFERIKALREEDEIGNK